MKHKQRSLWRVMYATMLLVTVASILILAAYWSWDEWSEFHEESDKYRAEFTKSQKDIIKSEVDRAIDSVYFWRAAARSHAPGVSEELLKEAVFERLSKIAFGPDNEYFIFVGDYNGVELVNRKSPHLIGKNFWEMEDVNGVKVFQEEIRIAKSKPEGDFFEYFWSETENRSDAEPKLSFVRGVPEWEIFVGAGANLNTTEEIIAARTNDRLAHFKRGVVAICVALVFALLIGFLATCWVVGRMRHSFDILALFFRKAVRESLGIDEGRMNYAEFADLAVLANQMITDRNVAEAALYESERQMCDMLANVQLCTVMLDTDGTITYANDHLLAMTGYSREEVVGGDWFDIFIPAQERERLKEVHRGVLSGNVEAVGRYENEILTKSGTRRVIFWSNAVFSYSMDGDVVGSTSFGEDITERRAAEREIENLAKFPSENPNPVLRIGADGVIMYANDAAPKLLNAWCCAGAEKLSETYCDIVEKVLASNEPCEIESYCPCGRTFTVMFAPVCDRGYVNIYGFDISERKKAQEEVRRHRFEMAHAARLTTVGEMASSLAHELNQPLCATMTHAEGCVRMLKSDSLDKEKFAMKLDTIVRQAERAGKIISRVHSFVRKGDPTRNCVDINDLIREACGLLELTVRNMQAEIVLDLDEGIESVIVDRVQVEQVLLNLAQNGLDAMKALAPEERRLTIRSSMVDGRVDVSVIDRGEGICEENLSSLFDSFYTTKEDGLGIGLSISRSIIESHGGRLSLGANCDRGATSRFSLPVEVVCQSC